MMISRNTIRRIRRKGESGIALISVLLLVATGSLIALLVMSISKTTSFTVLPFVQLQRSYYVMEGMAQRIQFLISADRELYDFIPLAVQMTVEWKDGTEECWLRRTAASGGNSVYGALQEVDE